MITGANTGVGFAAARALAAKDAHVYMASRNPEKQQRYLNVNDVQLGATDRLIQCLMQSCGANQEGISLCQG